MTARPKGLLVLLLLVFSASLSGQETEKLSSLNETVAKLAKAGQFSEAENMAQKAIDEARRIHGEDHLQTAITILNLGEIFLAQNKASKARDKYVSALKSLETTMSNNKDLGWRIHVKAVTAAAYAKDYKNGVAVLSKTKSFVDKYFASDKRILLGFSELELKFYLLAEKFRRVDKLFRERYRQVLNLEGKDSDLLLKTVDDHMCYSYNYFGLKGKDRIDWFRRFVKSVHKDAGQKLVAPVVNATATSLPKPTRPYEGASGIIPVRVVIKQGKVISATALCGNAKLRASSEEVALKSKFKPLPVETTGMIIYRYWDN